jgi:hypothetical protein
VALSSSARQTPATRAKDTDRNDICQILDTAMSEGQLSMEEHRQRVSAATNASTLGALRELVSDLQLENSPVHLPDLKTPLMAKASSGGRGGPVSAKVGWSIRIATAVVLVLFGMAIGWGLYGNSSSPLSFETDPGARADGIAPRVLTPPRQLLSQGGLEGLFEQMRKKFGSTTGFELDVRPERAFLRVPDPADVRRTLMYSYQGGWGDEPSESPTSSDARPVDLAAFDIVAVVGALRGAPDTVGFPANEVEEVRLDIEPSADPLSPNSVRLMVYVTDEFSKTAHFTLGPDGALRDIYIPS